MFLRPQHVRKGRTGRDGEFMEYGVVHLELAEILTTVAEYAVLQGYVFANVVLRVDILRR